MLREYEFTLVAKADLPEQDRAKVIEGYEEILKREGGQILRKDDWGVKKLAYPMKKQFRGQYVFYNFASTPANVAEAERLIRIDDNVLRHMVVKIADDVEVEKRRDELAKAALLAQQSREQ